MRRGHTDLQYQSLVLLHPPRKLPDSIHLDFDSGFLLGSRDGHRRNEGLLVHIVVPIVHLAMRGSVNRVIRLEEGRGLPCCFSSETQTYLPDSFLANARGY